MRGRVGCRCLATEIFKRCHHIFRIARAAQTKLSSSPSFGGLGEHAARGTEQWLKPLGYRGSSQANTLGSSSNSLYCWSSSSSSSSTPPSSSNSLYADCDPSSSSACFASSAVASVEGPSTLSLTPSSFPPPSAVDSGSGALTVTVTPVGIPSGSSSSTYVEEAPKVTSKQSAHIGGLFFMEVAKRLFAKAGRGKVAHYGHS